MVKEVEGKYKMTIGHGRTVSTGNYENVKIYEQMEAVFNRRDEADEVRQYLTSKVMEAVDGRLMLLGGFKTADTIEVGGNTMLKPEGKPETKVSQYIGGEIVECGKSISEDKWPPSIMCRECGQLVDRRESKFDKEINPYYYKCKCGKMNYSKGYTPKSKRQ